MDNSFIIYDNIPINEEVLYDLELCGHNSFVWQLGSADHELFSQSVPISSIENAENIPIESNKEDLQAAQACTQIPIEEKEFSKSSTDESKEPWTEKKNGSFECFQCGKRFTQRCSCNRHMREQHIHPESFRCKKCGLRFSKKCNLQTHEKRVHPKDRAKTDFKCPHCPCIFSNKAAWQKHEKVYHAKPQCQATCDLQDDNPQRDAENVVKQLMLLQKDLEDVNFHQQRTTPDKLNSTTAFDTLTETTTIDESQVNEITITDRLYPFGEFKELKVQQVRRNDGKYYLVCEFCSKELKNSYSYLRHRRIHCGIRPYICVLCKKSFPTQNQLKRHCSAHKITKGNVICKKSYKCPKCFEIKSTIALFDSHLSSHLPSSKITFKCQTCHKLFQSFRSFIYHKHKLDDPELNMLKSLLPSPLCLIEGKEVVGVLNTAVDDNFTCSLCGLRISSYISLKRHEKRHRILWKFQCHICNGYYSSQSSLQEHRKIHLNVKNFKCLKCPKAFRYNYQLQRHTLSHSNIKNFKCRYCEKIFKTPQYCRSHMLTHLKRLIHTHDEEQIQKENLIPVQTIIENEDKTGIEIRDMQFFQKKANTKKFTQNDGKRQNFKCMKCPLQFRYSAWLKKHMTQTHSDERPFKCEICFKSFRSNQVLKTHLLTHEYVGTKETCLVCGKKYSSKKSLNVHLKLHTNEKPFNCEVCQKSFRTSGHLIQHRKSNHK